LTLQPHATSDSRTYIVAALVVALHLGAGYLAISSVPQQVAEIARQPLWARVIVGEQGAAPQPSEFAIEAVASLPEPLQPTETVKSESVLAKLTTPVEPVPVEVGAAAAIEAAAPASLPGPAPAAYAAPPEMPLVAFMPSVQARLSDTGSRIDGCPDGRSPPRRDMADYRQRAECERDDERRDESK